MTKSKSEDRDERTPGNGMPKDGEHCRQQTLLYLIFCQERMQEILKDDELTHRQRRVVELEMEMVIGLRTFWERSTVVNQEPIH